MFLLNLYDERFDKLTKSSFVRKNSKITIRHICRNMTPKILSNFRLSRVIQSQKNLSQVSIKILTISRDKGGTDELLSLLSE